MIKIIRSAIGSPSSLGFIKLLNENNIIVIGVDIIDDPVGKFLTKKYFKVPKAKQKNDLIHKLISICKKEKPRLILSGPEEEINLLSKKRSQFLNLKVGILHPETQVLNEITNKLNLYNFFKDTEILVPITCKYQKNHQLSKDKCIIKPIFGRGSEGIEIINNFNHHLFDKDKLNKFIVQKYLAGKEYSVDALCDENGEWLNIVIRERIKTESGVSIVSKTVFDKKILKAAIKILEYIPLYGMSCIQFIKDKKGDPYLTDINPRPGGGSILSLRSSKEFQFNLVNLIKGKKTQKHVIKYDKLKMYRGYDEYFRS